MNRCGPAVSLSVLVAASMFVVSRCRPAVKLPVFVDASMFVSNSSFE